MRKIHLYIDGVVTAVGFRSFIKRHADALGIRGYVRNIEGGLEVVAEGENEALYKLIEHCKIGPSTAKVTNISIEEKLPDFIYKDFVIRP
jgi:acylphosphatase